MAGDFNCRDIQWDTSTVPPGSEIPSVCKKLIDTSNQHGLTQLQKEDTKLDSLLDLFFTNNPSLVTSIQNIPGISTENEQEAIVVDTKTLCRKSKIQTKDQGKSTSGQRPTGKAWSKKPNNLPPISVRIWPPCLLKNNGKPLTQCYAGQTCTIKDVQRAIWPTMGDKKNKKSVQKEATPIQQMEKTKSWTERLQEGTWTV